MSRLPRSMAVFKILKVVAPFFVIAGVLLSYFQFIQRPDPQPSPPDEPRDLVVLIITEIDGAPVQPGTVVSAPSTATFRGECPGTQGHEPLLFYRVAGAESWHPLARPECISATWEANLSLEPREGTILAVGAAHPPSAHALDALLRQSGHAVRLRLVDASVRIDLTRPEGVMSTVEGHAKWPPHYAVLVQRRRASRLSRWVDLGMVTPRADGSWKARIALRDVNEPGGDMLLRAILRPSDARTEVARPISSDEVRVRAPEPDARLVKVGHAVITNERCADALPRESLARVAVEARATLEGERVWLSLLQRRQRGNVVEQLATQRWTQLVPAEFDGVLEFDVETDPRSDSFDFAVQVGDDVPSAGSHPVVTCDRAAVAGLLARR